MSSRVNLTSSSISWIVPIKLTRKGQVIEISPEKSLAITSLLSMPERLTFVEVAPTCRVVTGTPVSCFPCWYDPCRGKHTCALLRVTKENPSFASARAQMLMLPFAKPSQSSSRTMPVSSANTTLIAQRHYCNLHAPCHTPNYQIEAQNLPPPTQPLCGAATKARIQSASQLLALLLIEADEERPCKPRSWSSYQAPQHARLPHWQHQSPHAELEQPAPCGGASRVTPQARPWQQQRYPTL